MSDTSHIGTIHTKDLPRDAVHIAIVQVTASETIVPGASLELVPGSHTFVKETENGKGIGIADPFIPEGEIKKGQVFYLFLYPNSITSLTHYWTHPSFATEEEKKQAQAWLDKHLFDRFEDPEWADEIHTDNSWMIEYFKEGKAWSWAHGDDLSEKYNANKDGFRKKFWDNLEIVTGIPATKEQRDTEYFSCSC